MITPGYCKASLESGWYSYSAGTFTITWTANANYSFGGTTLEDTVTTTFNDGGLSSNAPTYINISVSSTNCSAKIDSTAVSSGGIFSIGKTITWTAIIGYHFGSDRSKTTDTENIAYGVFEYSRTAVINTYSITVNCTNVTASASNPTTINHGESKTLTFTEVANYRLPVAPTFSGCGINSWSRPANASGLSTGTLVINVPTADITITMTGGAAMVNFGSNKVTKIKFGSNATIWADEVTQDANGTYIKQK